jgi:hypothetical protein
VIFKQNYTARAPLVLAVVALLTTAGCARKNSSEAVEAAIENHLRANSHLMLNSFTTHFESVDVNGNQATAVVKYASKNLPQLAVHVRYTLKLDHGQWLVTSSSTDAGSLSNPGNPHAGTALDQGSPPKRGLPPPVPSH